MSARRFEIPKVTEIRVTRRAIQAQPLGAPAQRDLVAASLLACPYGGEPGGRDPRRTA